VKGREIGRRDQGKVPPAFPVNEKARRHGPRSSEARESVADVGLLAACEEDVNEADASVDRGLQFESTSRRKAALGAREK
jgi:hypothetical protein